MNIKELKPCPFCGAKADVLCEKSDFLIIGCSEISTLCPNPSMTVYRDESGDFDFTYWNGRKEQSK